MVWRCIASKVVITHFQTEIVTLVGSLQICAEEEVDCEAIIHAVLVIY